MSQVLFFPHTQTNENNGTIHTLSLSLCVCFESAKSKWVIHHPKTLSNGFKLLLARENESRKKRTEFVGRENEEKYTSQPTGIFVAVNERETNSPFPSIHFT